MANWDFSGAIKSGFDMGFNSRMAGRKQKTDEDQVATAARKIKQDAIEKGYNPEDPQSVSEFQRRMAGEQTADTEYKNALKEQALAHAAYYRTQKPINTASRDAARLRELPLAIQALEGKKIKKGKIWDSTVELSKDDQDLLAGLTAEYNQLLLNDKIAGGAGAAPHPGTPPPAAVPPWKMYQKPALGR